MNKLTIIKEGHPTLAQVAKEVPIPLTEEDKATLKQMMMHIKMSQIPEIAEREGIQPGIGIAAPQINISKRMFVIFTQESDDTMFEYAFVNPEIIKKSEEMTYLPGGEGCLSVDRLVEGIVPRYKEITVKTKIYDIAKDQLRQVTLRLSGYLAIVFQHEFDHLDGILFPERVKNEIDDTLIPLWDDETAVD